MPNPTQPRAITTPLTTVGLQNQAHKKALDNTIKEIKKIIGIPSNQNLPPEIKKEIDKSLKNAEDKKIKKHVEIASNKVITEQMYYDSKLKLAEIAKTAKETVQSIANNSDYLKSLEETAKMMKAKYDAYNKAGFTNDQSFKLLEAELLSKRSR